MSSLNIQICPETGICSIVRASKDKIDLMPGEVIALRNTQGTLEDIRTALAEYSPAFANSLDSDELHQIKSELR